MKGRSASKIKLTSYDELLGGGEETNDIQQVSLEHLHSFENHPFQVNDDEAMAELVESVKEEGILTALLVRPLGDGEYEIIAGHRRRHAAQLAGLKEVPVIIRNMDQDTAVRAMVDSNLQRPNILPSEKAFAYRMKMEAMNHQGTSGGISAKDIGKNANDSARQVYRYIRLAFCRKPLPEADDFCRSHLCSNHPEEATLPLRWLCQLPLCGLAAQERLQAIILGQQVIMPTII